MTARHCMSNLFLFFFCLALQGFCSEDTFREINDQVIEHLINTNDPAIVAIENEQDVYFNSSKIVSHQFK